MSVPVLPIDQLDVELLKVARLSSRRLTWWPERGGSSGLVDAAFAHVVDHLKVLMSQPNLSELDNPSAETSGVQTQCITYVVSRSSSLLVFANA